MRLILQLGGTDKSDSLEFSDESYSDLLHCLNSIGIGLVHFHHVMHLNNRTLKIVIALQTHLHHDFYTAQEPTLTNAGYIQKIQKN